MKNVFFFFHFFYFFKLNLLFWDNCTFTCSCREWFRKAHAGFPQRPWQEHLAKWHNVATRVQALRQVGQRISTFPVHSRPCLNACPPLIWSPFLKVYHFERMLCKWTNHTVCSFLRWDFSLSIILRRFIQFVCLLLPTIQSLLILVLKIMSRVFHCT